MEKRGIYLAIKTLIEQGQYERAYELIVDHMKLALDDVSWHNFLGTLYEKQGNHMGSMRHFRAAQAPDVAYLLAKWNVELYDGFKKGGKTYAYLAEECQHRQAKKSGRGYEAV